MPRAVGRRLWFVALLALCACSVRQPAPVPEPGLRLLPPGELGTSLLLKQKVTLLANDRRQQFLAVARFEPQRLRLAVLLPSGQRLLTLDYDGAGLNESRGGDIALPSREILAVLQFAAWPDASIRRHYNADRGWRTELSADRRRLLTESGIALTIAYQPRVLRIDNHIREYRVIVETLEKTEL